MHPLNGYVPSSEDSSLELWRAVQGRSSAAMYSRFEEEKANGNFDTLPELHATLSGCKVTTCHCPDWTNVQA